MDNMIAVAYLAVWLLPPTKRHVFSAICLSVCLSVCNTNSFKSLNIVHVCSAGISPAVRVKFVYKGHQVKVKVTEAKSMKLPFAAM